MQRLVPAPLTSVALALAWLLLNGSAAPGHLVLGAVLGLALPPLLAPLTGTLPALRRPAIVARLALRVLRDIVVSNVQVAGLILGPEARIRPAYVRVPLALREPQAVAMLAGIVTMTPGTLSCAVAPDGGHLLVHALHVDDPVRLVDDIKTRYERDLMEIFA